MPDWNSYRLQNITWQFNLTDQSGNSNVSIFYKEYIDSINDPPILDPIINYTIYAFDNLSFNISASDVDNDGIENQTLTYSVNFTNVTVTRFNNTWAMVNWSPDNNYVGTNLINLSVTDSGIPNLSDSQVINITVIFVNEPPILHPIGDLSVNENESLYIQINATEPNNQTLLFSDNSTLFDINETTGIINSTN